MFQGISIGKREAFKKRGVLSTFRACFVVVFALERKKKKPNVASFVSALAFSKALADQLNRNYATSIGKGKV